MNPEQEQMQGQAMPPAGGEVTPEQVMEAEMDETQAKLQAIAETAPMPTKPYTYKAIDKFADAMNAFVAKVEPAMQAAEYDPPEGEKRLDGPLPPEVYVPYAIIMGFIQGLGDFSKYVVTPDSLVSDTALAKATANFGRMEKDKKLMEALRQPPEQPEEEEQPEMSEAEMETGRMPDDVDEDDEEIMNMM